MVLLTIVALSNPHTVYFDHDIAKPNYIRLLSASIYNSWYNLADNEQCQFDWLTVETVKVPAPAAPLM